MEGKGKGGEKKRTSERFPSCKFATTPLTLVARQCSWSTECVCLCMFSDDNFVTKSHSM